MKRVNNIIQILQKSYEIYADEFHEHFTKSFNASLISNNLYGGSTSLEYNTDKLNKFIDHCVYYRLGVSDVQPNTSTINYSLSSTMDAESIATSTEQIYQEIVYCAFPSKLINKLRKQLEANSLPENVIDLIVSKLETEQ